MHREHLTETDLRVFLEADHGEIGNRLLLHLLASCPECRGNCGYVLDLYEKGQIDLRFCDLDLDLARSRAEAPHLRAKLGSLPAAQRMSAVRARAPLRSWGLAELLCRESERLVPQDAAEALSLARLAVSVAEALKPGEPCESAWLLELRGFALAHRGNAERALGRFVAAEKSFRAAIETFEQGEREVGDDPLGYKAPLLAMLASLRTGQRRYPEALELLAAAEASDLEERFLGRFEAAKATIFRATGRFDEARVALQAAERSLGVTTDPRLALVVRHNLLVLLADLRRFEEALALLPSVRELAAEVGGEFDRLRLRWAEARIRAGLLDPNAPLIFREVRDGFASRGVPFESALATLELAGVLAESGEEAAAVAHLREALPILRAEQADGDVLAVWALFDSILNGAADKLDSISSAARFLRLQRETPTLRFVAELS